MNATSDLPGEHKSQPSGRFLSPSSSSAQCLQTHARGRCAINVWISLIYIHDAVGLGRSALCSVGDVTHKNHVFLGREL
jgi:hypothetical protein